MARNWTSSEVKDGQQCIELHRWDSFARLLRVKRIDEASRVWRGQAAHDWKLVPSIFRLPNPKQGSALVTHRLESQLAAFKFLSANSIGPGWDDENPDEIWAFAQHHGLATPLLDWTTSPYVAAFFAYVETLPRRRPAVFALCRDTVESAQRDILAERQEERQRLQHVAATAFKLPTAPGEFQSTFFEGIADQLEYELRWKSEAFVEFLLPNRGRTQRIVSQGSLFTRLSGDSSIEAWVGRTFDGLSKKVVLTKVLLPTEDREKALCELNSMNVNHLTLFPDVQGAAMYCNLAQTIAGYDRRFLIGRRTSESDHG